MVKVNSQINDGILDNVGELFYYIEKAGIYPIKENNLQKVYNINEIIDLFDRGEFEDATLIRQLLDVIDNEEYLVIYFEE